MKPVGVDSARGGLAIVTLALVATAAAAWPTFRATRVQPVEVLRAE